MRNLTGNLKYFWPYLMECQSCLMLLYFLLSVSLSMHYVIILKTRVVLSIYCVDMPTYCFILLKNHFILSQRGVILSTKDVNYIVCYYLTQACYFVNIWRWLVHTVFYYVKSICHYVKFWVILSKSNLSDDMLICQTHVSFCPHNVACVKFREQHHAAEQDNILIHQDNTAF